MEYTRTYFIIVAAMCSQAGGLTLPKPKALSVDCSSQGNNNEFKHRLKLREHAEDKATIWLFKDEELNINFQMVNAAAIDVLDVRYSNDGGVDTIAISLDGKELGQFKSKVQFGWGDLWDKFESSGPIGGYQQLKAGEHKLTVSILDADPYGIEIDYIRFNVHGSTVGNLRKDQFNCVHNPGHRTKIQEEMNRKIVG